MYLVKREQLKRSSVSRRLLVVGSKITRKLVGRDGGRHRATEAQAEEEPRCRSSIGHGFKASHRLRPTPVGRTLLTAGRVPQYKMQPEVRLGIREEQN